jgi:hypothetical protein
MKIVSARAALASFVLLPFAVAAVLAGCATASNEIAPDTLSCEQIATEMAGTRVARTQALEKQEDPWKFVIPFAVAGRHVAAASSVNEADRWLAELGTEAQRRGCLRRG